MTPCLSDRGVRSELKALPGWRLRVGAVRRIRKQYTLPDFVRALRFVNRVGKLAEAAAHHPDITVRYNVVTLDLYTHDVGGVTQRDLDLARRIDTVASAGRSARGRSAGSP